MQNCFSRPLSGACRRETFLCDVYLCSAQTFSAYLGPAYITARECLCSRVPSELRFW